MLGKHYSGNPYGYGNWKIPWKRKRDKKWAYNYENKGKEEKMKAERHKYACKGKQIKMKENETSMIKSNYRNCSKCLVIFGFRSISERERELQEEKLINKKKEKDKQTK